MSFSQGIENERASIILVVFNGMCSSGGKMKTRSEDLITLSEDVMGLSEDVDIYSMLQICGMSSSRIRNKPKIFISQLYDDG